MSALGDTVVVAPGTYSNYILYSNGAYVGRLPDGVVLMSEAGPSQTVIDLAPLEGVAIWSIAFGMSGHTSGQTVIDGFRVVGMPLNSRGVTLGECALVEVRNCSFEAPEGALTSPRSGVAGLNADLRVVNCTFVRCQRDAGGSGIQISNGNVTVEGCSFIECGTAAALGAYGTALEVRDCLFQRCVTTTGGGCIGTGHDDVVIDNCLFDGMEATDGLGAALSLEGLGATRVISNSVFMNMQLTGGATTCIGLSRGTTLLSGNTFVDLHQQPFSDDLPGVVLFLSSATVTLENNIFASTSGMKAIGVYLGPPPTTNCNVFWDNADGIGIDLSPTDRIADPQFCDPDNGDYTLQSTSPCLPDLSLGCGLIGALGQGCGTVSLTPETWGRIKSGFRTGEEE
ncbi:right-handed parallel beta-helix repeat-containing protein [bacterium]|nr:right-handed parallel beta-helix repeat-containing protein [bacterium]